MSSDGNQKPDGLLDRVRAESLRPKRRWPKVLVALLVLALLAAGAGFVVLRGSGLGAKLGLTRETDHEKGRRLFDAGALALKAGQVREAAILFRQAAEVRGNWSAPVRMQATCALTPGPGNEIAPEKAVELLHQALGIDPADDQSRLLLARVHLESGNDAKCLEVAKQALGSARATAENFPGELYDLAAKASSNLGDLDEAIGLAMLYLQRGGEGPLRQAETCLLLSSLHLRRAKVQGSDQDVRRAGDLLTQAESLVQGVVQMSSTDAALRTALAQVLLRKGDYQRNLTNLSEEERSREARKQYLRAVDEIDGALYGTHALGAHPEGQVLLKVEILDRLERRDDAEQILRAEYTEKPRWQLVATLASRKMRAGDEALLKEAAQILAQAKKDHPDRPEFKMMAVEVEARLGRLEDAARMSAEAEQQATGAGTDPSLYAVLMAHERMRAGEYDTAELDFRRAIEKSPRNLGARMGLLDLCGRRLIGVLAGAKAADARQAFDRELAEATRLAPDAVPVRLWTGVQLVLDGRLLEAEERLAQVVKVAPDLPLAHLFRGIGFQMRGDLDATIRSFQERLRAEARLVVAGSPPSEDAFRSLLDAYLAGGRFEQALLRGKEAVEAYPGSPALRFAYGTALLRQKDLEGAEYQFRELVTAHDEWGVAHGMLGQCLYLRGKTRDAEAEFEKGIRADESFRVRDLVARFFVSQGDDERARAEYERLVERYPGNPASHRLLGRFLMELDRRARKPDVTEPTENWGLAVTAFEKGIATDPEYLPNYAEVGEAYLRKPVVSAEDLDRAQEFVTSLLTRKPEDVEGRLLLARVYLARQEVGKAQETVEGVLADAPASAWCHILLAQALLQAAEPDLSRIREEADTALRILPGYPPALVIRSQVARLEGLASEDPDERIRRFEQALQDDPTNSEVRFRLAGTYASLADADPKNLELALTQARELMERQPDRALGYCTYGELLALKARRADDPELLRRAESLLRKAVELQPNTQAARLSLAFFLFVGQRWSEALEAYSKLMELDPSLGTAFAGVVSCLGHLDRWEDAERLCRNRLQAFPDPEGLTGYLHATSLERLGRDAEALETYRAVLVRNPKLLSAAQRALVLLRQKKDDAGVLDLLGALRAKFRESAFYPFQEGLQHLLQGRFAEARACLEEAIRIAPGYTPSYLALRDAYFRENLIEQAGERFEQLIEDHSDLAVLRFLGATIQEQLGRPRTAEKLYREALEMEPKYFVAANNLAWIYAWYLDRPGDAEGWAQRARMGLPKDPNVADTLAWVLVIQGKYRDALKLLDEAEGSLKDDVAYQFHRARALVGSSGTTRPEPGSTGPKRDSRATPGRTTACGEGSRSCVPS